MSKEKSMKKSSFLFAFIMSFLLISCGETQPEESIESMLEEEVSLEGDGASENMEQQDMLNALIMSMPSPLETSLAIKSSGADYMPAILNQAADKSYDTESKKAINMGVFGTDLGYINIYEQQLKVLSYVTALKIMAEDLNVGHFFDLEMVEKMSQHSEDMDSLILYTTKSFNEMDEYLREQNRGKVSVEITVGAWVEGLYILGEVYKQTQDEGLREKIAEQSIVVETMNQILSLYPNDPNLKEIAVSIGTITDLLNKVVFEETPGELEEVEVDGELMIIDTSTSKYVIDDETLEQLLVEVSKLRAKLIA